MVSLTEGTAKAAEACPGWINALVKCCLEGMTEIRDDPEGDWLDRNVSTVSRGAGSEFRVQRLTFSLASR